MIVITGNAHKESYFCKILYNIKILNSVEIVRFSLSFLYVTEVVFKKRGVFTKKIKKFLKIWQKWLTIFEKLHIILLALKVKEC